MNWRKRRRWAVAWLTELWLNARYEPWKLLPHPHKAVWSQNFSEYVCRSCGSSSQRVQLKGQRDRARLHRELA